MSRDLRATAILDARDNTGGAFASAARRLEALDRRMRTFSAGQHAMERSTLASVDRRGAMLDRTRSVLVGGATVLGTYGVSRMAAGAVKRYADVERAMTRVGITGEATDDEIAAGIERMRKLSQETAQPFDKMREGMEALTASGKSFQDSLSMMPSIARTAQASGAGMADTAKNATAILEHFNVKVNELPLAQDIIAKGGKMGQFEAKDMAQHFPSILPAAKAVGFSGIDGLKQLVSIAQTVRTGTGTSSEAADSLRNIIQKMEIEETAKKFKKFGVDLRKEMEDARKKGANLFETFLDLSEKALKGDMSKLPQLFQDSEVLRGMRPLLNGRNKIAEYMRGLESAAGTTTADLERVLKNKQTDVDRLAAAWDRFTTAAGSKLAKIAKTSGLTKELEVVSQILEGKTNPDGNTTTKRMEAHRSLEQRGRAPFELKAALGEEDRIASDVLTLREKLKRDPKFAERHDIAARVAQHREKLLLARIKGTDAAQRLMPALGAGGNHYEIPPEMPKRILAEATKDMNARDRGYHMRFGEPGHPPGAVANRPIMPKPGEFPVPPVRPNGADIFSGVPALDFGEAINSAKQGKIDIEASLNAIDLASSGQQAGASFKTGLIGELKQAESEATGIIARLKAALSFTASPKINTGGLNQGTSRAGDESTFSGAP